MNAELNLFPKNKVEQGSTVDCCLHNVIIIVRVDIITVVPTTQ